MTAPFVHLVIPAYNEGQRLPAYLPRLCQSLRNPYPGWQITVVDDGSREEDSKAMEKCAALCGPEVVFHRLRSNSGKGAAVYAGWDRDCESEWLGLLDADGSIPPYEVARVLQLLSQDNTVDALFCSRCKILGRTVHRSWLRHLCGRVFATFVCQATGIPVYDSQCGFKLIRRRCYEAVRSTLGERRFAFDVELLLALWRSGATIIEVPIDWSDVPGSKVRVLRDTAQMLMAILRLTRRHSAGLWRGRRAPNSN